MVNLDSRVIAPLLPTIATDFHTSVSSAGILITAYMLPYGLFQLVYGPLSERFGKVRVVAMAMLVFSVGTAACGLSSSLGVISLLRFLTGVAAAAVFPLTLSYIGDTVPYEQRQGTIAILMSASASAAAFSTSVGGLIAQFVSWRFVFPDLRRRVRRRDCPAPRVDGARDSPAPDDATPASARYVPRRSARPANAGVARCSC